MKYLKRISEAFANEDNFVIAYHGTDDVFDTFEGEEPFFFSEDKEYAKQYGSIVMKVRLNLGKAYRTTEDEVNAGGLGPKNVFEQGYDSWVIYYPEDNNSDYALQDSSRIEILTRN